MQRASEWELCDLISNSSLLLASCMTLGKVLTSRGAIVQKSEGNSSRVEGRS